VKGIKNFRNLKGFGSFEKAESLHPNEVWGKCVGFVNGVGLKVQNFYPEQGRLYPSWLQMPKALVAANTAFLKPETHLENVMLSDSEASLHRLRDPSVAKNAPSGRHNTDFKKVS
jgi:hypothetical protein